jgi:hypothetical protein
MERYVLQTREDIMSEPTPRIDLRDKGYSFRVSAELLDHIVADFGSEKLLEQIGADMDVAAISASCAEHGRILGQRTMELGEQYQDRIYQVIREVASQTGMGPFPHVVQRFLEVAYLSLLPIKQLRIVQTWAPLLTYAVVDSCAVFDSLKSKLGEEKTREMPCKALCLSLVKSLLDAFELDTQVRTDALMTKDGRCQFTVAMTSRLPGSQVDGEP